MTGRCDAASARGGRRPLRPSPGRLLLALASVAALAVPSAWLRQPANASSGAPVRLGDSAPVIELDDLAGNRVSLSHLAGQTVVIQFFATWCEPCHRAWQDLVSVRADAKAAAAPRTRVVLVNLGETREVVARWAADARLDDGVRVVLDRNGTAASRWGANRLPTIFVVDAEGIIRHINRGWGEGYKERLRRWLSTAEKKANVDAGGGHP